MKTERPDLIIFSQNLLGGGASFHRNMLAHFPDDPFNKKTIYLNPTAWDGTKSLEIALGKSDEIFSYGNEPAKTMAARMTDLIGNGEGAIVANLEPELITLDIHRKPGKTVFFICHDAGFLPLAVKFQSIIDVFIAHNITVYQDLKKLVGDRNSDIFFIQHGVNIPQFEREYNATNKLRMVFLARHHAFKGLFDLPVIDDLLTARGVEVDWMILGDGPDRNEFIKMVGDRPNFKLHIPKTAADVLAILKDQDVFILPSRSDGLPVALLEAMSAGCVPLLANFSEGIKEVVSEDIGYVLPVGDNEGFADKIALLAADRSLLAQLGANCREKVKREFDISKQAMEYFNLYKEYKKFKKRRSASLSDLRRRAEYSSFFNKATHALKAFKTKLIGPGSN